MLPYASLKITFSFIIIILLSDLEKINNLVNITYYSYHSKFVQLSSKIIFYSRYVLLSQDLITNHFLHLLCSPAPHLSNWNTPFHISHWLFLKNKVSCLENASQSGFVCFLVVFILFLKTHKDFRFEAVHKYTRKQ